MTEPLHIVVVGHTNAGKTSLLRTLTRRVDFGEVSDRPGTTRHAESVDLRLDGPVLARFVDTPGLEDSVALLGFLNRQVGETPLERTRAFLAGPEARAAFEQEAKVLRALLDGADCAMLVIDTREPVLPKHRAEVEILGNCTRPIMPVLNFVSDAASRQADWQQLLAESRLHARVSFDAVAPFQGAERQLYTDLATLLPQRREQLADIVDALVRAARHRQRAACRVVAGSLIDVAAMRRTVSADDYADELQKKAFVRAFQDDVRAHARRGVHDLLALFGFRPGDAELADMAQLDGRWEDDLFNPELLAEAGKRVGLGAVIGGGMGAVADVMMAGLSLGAATTLGATMGGVFSGGLGPMWRKIGHRLRGGRELTAEDAVLVLLADHLCMLARALAQRGHAAQQPLQVTASKSDHRAAALQPMLRTLDAARGHPEWERQKRSLGIRKSADASDRLALEEALARQFEPHVMLVPSAALADDRVGQRAVGPGGRA